MSPPNIKLTKMPFADYSYLLQRYPRVFMGILDDSIIFDLINSYDVYIDRLYGMAASGEDWKEFFEGTQLSVFIANFKETVKRLDKITSDKIKTNRLSETIVKIKH